MQLLLGYQLLGIGQLDECIMPLKNANLDMENKEAATVLLRLLSKIKINDLETEKHLGIENAEPDKVEPTIPDTINLDVDKIENQDSENQILQFKTTNPEADNFKENELLVETKAIPGQSHSKTKGGVLLAALCVLAGSTGIGHFIHH